MEYGGLGKAIIKEKNSEKFLELKEELPDEKDPTTMDKNRHITRHVFTKF